MEIENLDENAAWHKVFTSGSEELKSKLKKVHAKNPKFQAFLKSGGYKGEQKSAAQAKKDVAVINKAKAKAKVAKPKKVDRIELIRRAQERRNERTKEAKLRRAFGGEPLGAEHDNPISMARAGIPIRGYRLGEEVVDETHHMPLLAKQEKVRKDLIDKEMAAKREKRQAGTSYGRYAAMARKMRQVKLEESSHTAKEAEKVLGGPTKLKSSLPPGKHPAGYRRARSLARAALKNLLAQRKGK